MNKATDKKKVVEQTKKGIPLNLDELLTNPHDSEYFTTLKKELWYEQLSDLQKKAIDNIEDYWQNKVKNFKNWKRSKHFGYKKESISARISGYLYHSIKFKNRNKLIQNFIRFLLRNEDFQEEFREKLREQSKKDLNSLMFELGEPRYQNDITAFMKKLKELYPYVVSGEIKTLEKELFVFYCYFFTPFSISYILRCGLLFEYEIETQEPIQKFEVYEILKKLIKN